MNATTHIANLSLFLEQRVTPGINVLPAGPGRTHTQYIFCAEDRTPLFEAILITSPEPSLLIRTPYREQLHLPDHALDALLNATAPLNITELAIYAPLTDTMRATLRTRRYRYVTSTLYRTSGGAPILTRQDVQRRGLTRHPAEQALMNLNVPAPPAPLRPLLKRALQLAATGLGDPGTLRTLEQYTDGYLAARTFTQTLQLLILTDLNPQALLDPHAASQVDAVTDPDIRERLYDWYAPSEDFKEQLQAASDLEDLSGLNPSPAPSHADITARLTRQLQDLSDAPPPLLGETLTPWAAALRATDLTPLRPPLQAAAQAIIAAEDARHRS